ncbi:MAG: FtsX-like permease family protein [Lachnospiraceae bacterium]|nr:FtsX-like permease family protein [Lachnospiraceae bacterium]
MNKAYLKNILRTIGKSKGRYFAIMAIIALGVGFFSGIKVTKPAMIASVNGYYQDHNFYDYRLLSTYGFTDEEVEKMQEYPEVVTAEGAYSTDFLFLSADDKEAALKAMSLPSDINTVELKAGRLPQADNECVLDASKIDTTSFSDELIGTTIVIADSNSDTIKDSFKYEEYTIVGLVYSPLYISFERGTTSLGNGKLEGFMYIPKSGFDLEYYTEMYAKCQMDYDIYEEDYEELIENLTPDIEAELLSNATERYNDLLADIEAEYNEAVVTIENEVTAQVEEEFYNSLYANGLNDEMIDYMLTEGTLEYPQDVIDETIEELVSEIELPELEEPEVFVLDRTTNTGYVCYDNDTNIVDGLAKVFPVFFFLIAALVCSTTMTRMIDDERGQIGTLRAVGYTNAAIIWKYMVYSGSAAIIGCLAGFFGGSYIFPYVIGEAYKMLYDFGRSVEFYFDPVLLIITIIVSLICSVGTTYLACRNELRCMPAELIRPKAPAAGKRILMERITPIWKRMKFLHKITTRNVFRFKKRMIMMVMGIAGCTALVMAGFGIKDSVSNIAEFQYDEIEVYDMEVTFNEGITDETVLEVEEVLGDDVSVMSPLLKTTVEYHSGDTVKTVYICGANKTDMESVMNYKLVSGDTKFPGYGQIMLSDGIADAAGVKAGDTITLSNGDGKNVTLEVSAVYTNYVWHYGYVTPDTYADFFGEEYNANTIYINVTEDADSYELGAELSELDSVLNVTVVEEVKNMISNTMKMLDMVVWLVIGCAGALAFIVLFNLSNINITERVREIATIKVLGFYQRETGAYVFRENLVLTFMGIIVGIPLGVLLNGFIISQIKVDMFIIKETLFPISYVLTVVLVFIFLKLTDWVMRGKIEGIDMAESLKSIE